MSVVVVVVSAVGQTPSTERRLASSAVQREAVDERVECGATHIVRTAKREDRLAHVLASVAHLSGAIGNLLQLSQRLQLALVLLLHNLDHLGLLQRQQRLLVGSELRRCVQCDGVWRVVWLADASLRAQSARDSCASLAQTLERLLALDLDVLREADVAHKVPTSRMTCDAIDDARVLDAHRAFARLLHDGRCRIRIDRHKHRIARLQRRQPTRLVHSLLLCELVQSSLHRALLFGNLLRCVLACFLEITQRLSNEHNYCLLAVFPKKVYTTITVT